MIGLEFTHDPQVVTCLGAHPDDIEIGAGATLLHLAARYPDTSFRFLVLTGTDSRQVEARDSAVALLGERVELELGGLDENFLPYTNATTAKAFIHDVGRADETDVVLAPQSSDLHQDHRFVAEVALQAFRDHLILGYEIPKYDGDFGNPGLYVALSEGEVDAKLDHLGSHFPSQHDKPWYSREVFSSVMRIRGMEARSTSGFAEGFTATKSVLR